VGKFLLFISLYTWKHANNAEMMKKSSSIMCTYKYLTYCTQSKIVFPTSVQFDEEKYLHFRATNLKLNQPILH